MLFKSIIINKIFIVIFFISNCVNFNLSLSYNLFDNLKHVVLDLIEINISLLSSKTFYTLGLATPLYLSALSIDTRLHYLFYDQKAHRNIRQLELFNSVLNRQMSDNLLANFIILSSLGIFSDNKNFQDIGYKLMLGLCSMGLVKKIIKLINWDGALRPNNQYFIHGEKYYGGFPSGHLMTMSYLNTIWIQQFGLKDSSLLILATTYMFVDYLVQNRHYISQLIAGSAIGIIYGCAVNFCLNQETDKDLKTYISKEAIKLDMINKNLRFNYYF